jgi:hypothetical protein
LAYHHRVHGQLDTKGGKASPGKNEPLSRNYSLSERGLSSYGVFGFWNTEEQELKSPTKVGTTNGFSWEEESNERQFGETERKKSNVSRKTAAVFTKNR